MTASALVHETKRVRASERALRVALKAMHDAGLSVDKLCVTGSQIEIHCGAVEGRAPTQNHTGLEKW